MMKQELLNDEFFAWHKKYAEAYALTTGKRLFEHFKPKSVVDFGCGIGSYLLAAKRCGVGYIKDFEIGGEFARKYTHNSIFEYVDFNADITKPIIVGPFDISICVEVAEHIEPSGSEMLVENITKATDRNGLCMWTAAPPGQEGCGHINCKPKEYWIKLFKEYGFLRSVEKEDIVRDLIKESPKYIIDNLMIFCL